MKNMLNTIITCFVFIISDAYGFCQSAKTMDYEINYNAIIIKPTWNNIFTLMFLDDSSFSATMKKYNYSLTSNKESWIAGTGAGEPYYTIKRSASDIYIYSEKDTKYISQFRDEIRQKLIEPTAEFDGGFENYYARVTIEGIKYRVQISFKKTAGGGSMIGLFLK